MGEGHGNGTGGGDGDELPRRAAPVEHSRLAIGCLWGVPFSLALWALILWALWRLVS